MTSHAPKSHEVGHERLEVIVPVPVPEVPVTDSLRAVNVPIHVSVYLLNPQSGEVAEIREESVLHQFQIQKSSSGNYKIFNRRTKESRLIMGNMFATTPNVVTQMQKRPRTNAPELETGTDSKAPTWTDLSVNPLFLVRLAKNPKLFFEMVRKLKVPTTSVPFEIPVTETVQVIAIGDLHGDIDACLRTLWYAGLIDGVGNWRGGKNIVVQLGDQIDRKRDWDFDVEDRYPELEVFVYTQLLSEQATEAGGAFYSLLGNHEMFSTNPQFENVYDFYRNYVSMSDKRAYTSENIVDENGDPHNNFFINRHVMFKGGFGDIARKFLSTRGVVLKIGNVVFSHADVGATIAENGGGTALKGLNEKAFKYLTTGAGDATTLLQIGVTDGYAVPPVHALWNRFLCQNRSDCTNWLYKDTYFVAAHTTQEGKIKGRCDNHVWCIDTQRSAAFGEDPNFGRSQSLKITISPGNSPDPVFEVLGAGNVRAVLE